MAGCWLPNTEEFFFSLARLIESLERQLHLASYDNSEFLFQCLDEYERTLATLLARFVESMEVYLATVFLFFARISNSDM